MCFLVALSIDVELAFKNRENACSAHDLLFASSLPCSQFCGENLLYHIVSLLERQIQEVFTVPANASAHPYQKTLYVKTHRDPLRTVAQTPVKIDALSSC